MEEEQKKRHYQSCFATNDSKIVLDDLSNYCYENRSTFVEGNHDKQNVNNGKRAVILYIRDKLKEQTEPRQTEVIHKE